MNAFFVNWLVFDMMWIVTLVCIEINMIKQSCVILVIIVGMLAVPCVNATLDPAKEVFVNKLALVIKKQNHYLLKQREAIQCIFSRVFDGQTVSVARLEWLRQVARIYKVKPFLLNRKSKLALLSKLNVIPPSMVIAQAAIESNWGRSRFATEARNLFGIWCFTKGCGVVPLRRTPGQIHEVKKYTSQANGVIAYFFNMNTHPAYRQFRRARQKMVSHDQPLLGLKLAKYLGSYSQLGSAYSGLVIKIITKYRLTRFDQYLNT